jgi:hypothetical protein
VTASRALESRNSNLPYIVFTKAAVGYHPFGRPRDKFPEPLLGCHVSKIPGIRSDPSGLPPV